MFRIVPTLVSVKAQFGEPGRLAVPLAVTLTVVALASCPDAVPAMVTPPPHSAVKLPAKVVDVWAVTAHPKLPQLVGVGVVVAWDDHWPVSGVDTDVPPPAGAVGSSTLDDREKPHAVAARIAKRGISFFIVFTR